MDKTMRLTISVPGDNRAIDPGAVLADLARKLSSVSLASGQHEIIIFADGMGTGQSRVDGPTAKTKGRVGYMTTRTKVTTRWIPGTKVQRKPSRPLAENRCKK
ncbi:MAG: hypothetical protein H0X30_17795 [Anaerolineae bacterium]|nr:hypothetical protein [Anaerolineae bacterium]